VELQPNFLVLLLQPPSSPRPPSSPKHEISPQAYLGSMTASRGYSKNEFPAMESSYFSEATDFQKSSYGTFYLSAVQGGNSRVVRRLLLAGLSPNAANARGASVLHTACRMGQTDIVRLLLDFGAEVQVCDDSGRTPLHDACWSDKDSFEIIEMILRVDKRMLFFTDSRGEAPLSYVRREDWTSFTRFLMSKKNRYWPDRDFAMLGPEEEPEVLTRGPNSRPITTPSADISLDAIADLASGINTKRGTFASSAGSRSLEDGLTEYSESSYSENFEGTEFTEDDDYDDSDSDSDDDDDDEETSLASFDEDELNDILRSLDSRVPIQWSK
jgi:hypothetical protein